MRRQMKEPLRLTPVAALVTTHDDTDNTASRPRMQVRGKALPVTLYNVGGRTLDETRAAFDRNPGWRVA